LSVALATTTQAVPQGFLSTGRVSSSERRI
jgi:hypothetical protein